MNEENFPESGLIKQELGNNNNGRMNGTEYYYLRRNNKKKYPKKVLTWNIRK